MFQFPDRPGVALHLCHVRNEEKKGELWLSLTVRASEGYSGNGCYKMIVTKLNKKLKVFFFFCKSGLLLVQ